VLYTAFHDEELAFCKINHTILHVQLHLAMQYEGQYVLVIVMMPDVLANR
jgi:hypothetical protein